MPGRSLAYPGRLTCSDAEASLEGFRTGKFAGPSEPTLASGLRGSNAAGIARGGRDAAFT